MPKTVTVPAGRGLRPVAPTVRAAVRAAIMRAQQAQQVAFFIRERNTAMVNRHSDEVFKPGHPLYRGILPRPGYTENVAAYGADEILADIERGSKIPEVANFSKTLNVDLFNIEVELE